MNELPSTAAGLMHLLPSTSDQINSFAISIVNSVKDGHENPLDVLLQMRAMEKAFEAIKTQIRDNVLREADKYPGTTFKFKGVELAKGDVSTTYDYEVCGDTKWERLNVDATEAKKKLSERETFLKSLKEPITCVDEMTGEVVEIRPPLKKSIPGVKFYFR